MRQPQPLIPGPGWGQPLAMDQRTKALLEDHARLQEGGEGNSFAEIAREWANELEARRKADLSAFERFFSELGTLVVRCSQGPQDPGQP